MRTLEGRNPIRSVGPYERERLQHHPEECGRARPAPAHRTAHNIDYVKLERAAGHGSSSRVGRLCTGRPSAVVLKALLRRACSEVRVGLHGRGALGGGAFAVVVLEQHRRQALARMPFLANGWRLGRRRLMGAERTELEGPVDTDLPVLKRLGCVTEIVRWAHP